MAEVQNNKDNVPAKHYAEIYHDANPLEISVRTAVPYDEARKVFLFTLMNSVYEITHPDFSVRFRSGEGDRLSGYTFGHILLLRYLTCGQFVRPGGRFLSYRENPWGDVYLANFNNRCNIPATCSFEAEPLPVIAILIFRGAYSWMGTP